MLFSALVLKFYSMPDIIIIGFLVFKYPATYTNFGTRIQFNSKETCLFHRKLLLGQSHFLLYGISNPQKITAVRSQSFFINTLAKLHVQSGVMTSLTWRWTAKGVFTCALAYAMMYDGGITCDVYARPSQIKAPLKVRVFLWVATQNKLLAQETVKGLQCLSWMCSVWKWAAWNRRSLDGNV